MNKNDYIIRLEENKDYREVENLVRESFWNIYRPGCKGTGFCYGKRWHYHRSKYVYENHNQG